MIPQVNLIEIRNLIQSWKRSVLNTSPITSKAKTVIIYSRATPSEKPSEASLTDS